MTGNHNKKTAQERTRDEAPGGLRVGAQDPGPDLDDAGRRQTKREPGFDPVALAEKNFNRVLSALDALADELHGREDSAVAKAAKLAGEARSAIQTIFNERQRIAKLDDDTSGALGAELDLDAARLEIGRRLALLRGRGEPEAVPGRAE